MTQTMTLDIETDAGTSPPTQEDSPPAAPSAPPVVSSTKEPTRPVKLEEDDTLKVTNLHLLVENCNLQIQLIESDLEKAKKARQEHYMKLVAFRNQLSTKYGVDFITAKVKQDGTIEYPPEGAGIPANLATLLRGVGG